jgi:hypothetical protein
MSKVLSFSVPDSWLAALTSLYPGETPNLAAKKALGDILDRLAPEIPSNTVLDDYLTKSEFEQYTASNLRELNSIISKIEGLTSKLSRLDELESKIEPILDEPREIEALVGK